jgi:phosphoribosylaminoimidazolecarboxamide formyltransferase/IMP cyclohydrolase
VVNLYPFEATVAKPGCTLAEAIENIDVGGPAMLRAAAKNHETVAVIVDSADYGRVLDELRTHHRGISAALKAELAAKAFALTAAYDGAIANYLTSLRSDGTHFQFPGTYTAQFRKLYDLRYGENPHQQAAFYAERGAAPGTLAAARQRQGKDLSFNNIADADAALACVRGLDTPACVIVKHANPCGVALGGSLLEAYQRAYSVDPESAFGGIIAFNREVDRAAAEHVAKQFVEVLMAPAFSAEARAVFAARANVRVLQIDLPAPGEGRNAYDVKRVGSGLLMQSADNHEIAVGDLRVVTTKAPTPAQTLDLLFAWKVAKYVKSNAIVFCADGMTVGVGAGQMSRLDSARIAAIKAEAAGLSLKGSAVASDAFFPFRDGLDVIIDVGASCVIQPGGSMRDDEVIAAANERGVAMVFTGVRHFRH